MKFLNTDYTVNNWNAITKAQFKLDIEKAGVYLTEEQLDNLLDVFEDIYDVRKINIQEVNSTFLSRVLMPFVWIIVAFIVCPLNYVFKGHYQLDKKSIFLKFWNKFE